MEPAICFLAGVCLTAASVCFALWQNGYFSRTAELPVRELRVGDSVVTKDGERRVSKITLMDGTHGGPQFLIGGVGIKSAVALEVTIGTRTHRLHPAEGIRIVRA